MRGGRGSGAVEAACVMPCIVAMAVGMSIAGTAAAAALCVAVHCIAWCRPFGLEGRPFLDALYDPRGSMQLDRHRWSEMECLRYA